LPNRPIRHHGARTGLVAVAAGSALDEIGRLSVAADMGGELVCPAARHARCGSWPSWSPIRGWRRSLGTGPHSAATSAEAAPSGILSSAGVADNPW